MQAPGADVFGLFVDLMGDFGEAADAVRGEFELDPLGFQ